MALTQEQRQKAQEYFKKQESQNYTVNNFLENYSKQTASKPTIIDRFKGTVKDVVGIVPAVGETLKETGQRGADTLGRAFRGEADPLTTGLAFTGDIARGISETVGDVIFGAGKAVLPVEVEQKIQEGFRTIVEPLTGPITNIQSAWEEVKEKHPNVAESIEGMLNIGMLGADVAGFGAGAKVTKGVGKAGKELIEEGIEKVGKKVVSGIDEIGETTKGVGEYLTTQVTGLTPETVETLIKNPAKITKAQADDMSRMTLARNVEDVLNSRLDELTATGKEYNLIRQSDEVVNLPENALLDFVKTKYKLGLDDAGKLKKTRASYPMENADLNALQGFLDLYGDTNKLTAEEFLNSRTAISNIAKYDQAKSNTSKIVAKDLRKYLDSFGKKQIRGLSDLDKRFSSEKKVLDTLKKDLFDRDGNLKSSAVSSIANISGKGKEVKLNRLKELVPDIEEKARIVKTLENIEDAQGITVGTYARGILAGGGLATGNIPAIVGAIITSPSVIVPLLKKFGEITKNINIGDLAKKIKAGKALTVKEKNFVQKALQNAASAISGASVIGTRKAVADELSK